MKKIKIILSIFLLVVFVKVNSQVRIVNSVSNSIVTNSSAFLDASSNTTVNASTNIGKGLLYPRVDLTTFASFGGSSIGLVTNYPTRYDGLVVYNTGTGNTLPSAATTIVAVTPGFWYYSNKSGTVTGGTWIPFVSGSITKNVTTTEVALATKVNGAQLYAIAGTFTASGTSTSVTVAIPTGMTGYYSMITYQGGKTFRREIYSFDTTTSTNNVITGNGIYSEVYPAGTYNYVLEYFK